MRSWHHGKPMPDFYGASSFIIMSSTIGWRAIRISQSRRHRETEISSGSICSIVTSFQCLTNGSTHGYVSIEFLMLANVIKCCIAEDNFLSCMLFLKMSHRAWNLIIKRMTTKSLFLLTSKSIDKKTFTIFRRTSAQHHQVSKHNKKQLLLFLIFRRVVEDDTTFVIIISFY